MKQFVYIDGLRGPEPQIWHDKVTVNGKSVKPLKSVPLAAEDDRSIEQLVKEHPYEQD